MRSIFVSYSRNDQEAVGRMVAKLQALGYKVWHDQKLTGGQKWWDTILKEIRGCDVLVFALSAASLDSEACQKEHEYAVALGKTLIPVQIANDVHLKTLPPRLGQLNVVDYRAGDESATLMLVGAINTCPTAADLPAEMPAAPGIPLSYLSTLNDKVMARHKLSEDEQCAICTHLAIATKKGHTTEEIRYLAEQVMKRDDLLATVKEQIERFLATLDAPVRTAPVVASSFAREPTSTAPFPVAPSVATIVQRHGPRIHGNGIHHAPMIPATKLNAAIRAMRCTEPRTDVLLLHDATVFGTGETGWMVTATAFYKKQLWNDPETLAWRNLRIVTWSTGLLTSTLRINDTIDLDFSVFGRGCVQSFGEMLLEIRDTFGRPLAPPSGTPAIEVTMQGLRGVCPKCGMGMLWAPSKRHNVIPCSRCQTPLKPR